MEQALETTRATSSLRADVVGPALARRHTTVVEALEAAATDHSPLLTFHVGREPVVHDARATLEGAWRAAAALRRAGVEPGETVPILLPTSPALVHALLGSMLAGAIPVPLATPMTFGAVDRFLDNLDGVLKSCGARIAVTDERLSAAMAADERLHDRIQSVLTPKELEASARSDWSSRSLHTDDVALLQYTSGTTGDPKGVAISHRALTANAAAIAHGLAIDEHDVGVSWLPLYHDMGLIGVLMTAVCHPYPIHVMRPETFVMQPRRWLSVIAKARGTLSVAPNFAYDLCVRRGAKFEGSLDSWRVALDGAEPVRSATLERFVDQFGPRGFRREALTPVYGMAESTLAVSFSPPASRPHAISVDPDSLGPGDRIRRCDGPGGYSVVSLGGPVAGASVRIANDQGRILEERRVGEVLVSGTSLMDGYYRCPEATAATLRDGWLHSGDRGFILNGELYVVGRAKEVVIIGGRNVYPYDVERIAAEVPGVAGAVAAVGIDNPNIGTQELAVVVEARARDEADRSKIAKAVRGELLAAVGVKAEAVHVWPVGAIPRTTSGKIRRAACAQVLTTPTPGGES